jgi:SAM-dependent methyltransferase
MSQNMDQVYSNPEDYEYVYQHPDSPSFWVEVARRRNARNILELGVGDGRVAIPLALAGYRVTGLDISENMLKAAAQAIGLLPEAARARIDLMQADMIHFEIPDRQFDLTIVPSLSLQHLLTIDDQLSCLLATKAHLVHNGALVVDVFNPNIQIMAECSGPSPKVTRYIDTDTRTPGRHIIRYDSSVFSEKDHQLEVQQTIEYYTDQVMTRKTYNNQVGHMFFPRELELLFRLAGYTIPERWGCHAFSHFDSKSPRQIVVGIANAAEAVQDL